MFLSKADEKLDLASKIENAEKELQEKSLNEINRETALTWAARAIAAKKLKKDADYDEYAHESLEHACLTKDINFITKIVNLFKSEK